jgi:hypothetical protein
LFFLGGASQSTIRSNAIFFVFVYSWLLRWRWPIVILIPSDTAESRNVFRRRSGSRYPGGIRHPTSFKNFLPIIENRFWRESRPAGRLLILFLSLSEWVTMLKSVNCCNERIKLHFKLWYFNQAAV